MANALIETQAGQILLLTDCCHAAAFGKEFFPASQKNLTESLMSKPGLTVFSACQSNESSYENSEWQHGAFTFAILEALSGKKADKAPRDGRVNFDELRAYVCSRVSDITQNQQNPAVFKFDKPLSAIDK